MLFWSAFVIGLVGSLHCIGMCGPILISLPETNNNKYKMLFGRLLYNLGRIVTYSYLGIIFGLLGNRLKIFGMQQTLSIIIGVLLLLSVIIPGKIKSTVSSIKPLSLILAEFQRVFTKVLNKSDLKSLFIIGLLNGLLPCGLVYVALAGAAQTDSVPGGFLFMFGFGLGTLPLMFVTSIFTSLLSFQLKLKIRRFIPYLTGLVAILFILRGLNLGIPYISPELYSNQPAVEQTPKCH